MGSRHLLAELDLPGRALALAVDPELDLYRASRVLRLEVDLARASGLPALHLDLEYIVGGVSYVLRLLFDDVRELEIPPFGTELHIVELEIEDVRDRMLEGIRFDAVSRFDASFRCSCRTVQILGLSLRDCRRSG